MADPVTIKPYKGPAGGWGSAKSLTEILLREQIPLSGGGLLLHQNKPDGFMCVSCAWAKPAKPSVFEYCENGAKATAWEVTRRSIAADFFAKHTVTELEGWRDYDLEELGRLTEPMRWDAATDTYRPVPWAEAFREIGTELRALAPKSTVFYASGRASLEASYMYGLLARLYGNNNLPDSSNMCHESTSVALPESIGSPVGTVLLEDFEHTDCILFFGQNPGSNAPRMLHPLQDASKRGVPIITFNPFRERGLESFTNPQSPLEMLTRSETRISSQYLQVKAGGDLGAIYGLCKALLEADDAAQASGGPRLIDTAFIAEHTHGFEAFADSVRARTWDELERHSGLPRAALEQAARTYGRSKATLGIYGMGLTQHRMGVETVQMLVNLLLLRGNVGRPGAGICPVRGHSNVQGQRTVGITEKPELVPNATLKALYGFDPPAEKGLNTVEACEGILDGSVRAFVALGGNFIRAVPETDLMEPAWRKLRLTVQISTKLNRNHLIHGEVAYILPCLGRVEIDAQPGGRQSVAMEDSTACIHGSKGYAEPASRHLLSEPRIVAEIAKATLAPNERIDWDRWGRDYASVRDAIEATYPAEFKNFNARMWQPGGFRRPIPAADRVWKTPNGKANFIVPRGLSADPDTEQADPDVMRLITMRSNDQFNTTIYGYDDRFRGVKGTRMVLFMNKADIARLGFRDAQSVNLVGAAQDGIVRRVEGFRVLAYDVPAGCVGGYYPECNPLIPLWHHAERSKVPAAKSVPVRIEAAHP
ncbi:Protein YdeP [Methylobacterium crusticola]|uniref:Protein YdeP n=1 Tax=Methylobacterium crusticola TaxID=1697972 RepID=A0ABQ4QX11_9HYPH|nr:FdhF/YdeP family oxidoreductase [Methylobacterium crusticola]GJD49727.1 Protein YdeP [Methylobacterium crusticola]